MADQSPQSENRLTAAIEYDWSPPHVRARLAQLVDAAAVWAQSERAAAAAAELAPDLVCAVRAGREELAALLLLCEPYATPLNTYERGALALARNVPAIAYGAVRWTLTGSAFVDVCAAADAKNEPLQNLLICACLLARAARGEPTSGPDADQAFCELAATAIGTALL